MVLFRVLFVLSFVGSCFGLRCFECENVELDTDNSIVKSIIGSLKSNTACASTTFDALDNKVNVRTCSSGQVCGFVKGEVTFQVFFVGSVGAKVHARSCIASSQRSGCVTDNTKIESILGFVAKLTDVKIDADLCFCDYDLCVSGGCGDDKYAIGPICMLKWLVFVIGGGVLLTIIGLMVCFIYCCCQSKKTRGVVIGVEPPAVGVVHQPQNLGVMPPVVWADHQNLGVAPPTVGAVHQHQNSSVAPPSVGAVHQHQNLSVAPPAEWAVPHQNLAQGYNRMEEPQLKNYAV